ncbi:hypothetical protein GCM10027290_29360 [Micromonospora sonneratiae]|uniref:Uncharacterized protein n=1 Tax=Micromonospora sonneratiae TaxID=1184706 RepID=A0ABW3YIB6_9ACTN
MSFELDGTYFGDDQAIAANLASLDLHGPHCSAPAGLGQVTLIDLRHHGNPIVNRYR